jgi:hypothetical protein
MATAYRAGESRRRAATCPDGPARRRRDVLAFSTLEAKVKGLGERRDLIANDVQAAHTLLIDADLAAPDPPTASALVPALTFGAT